jgi:hypothetical protein
LDKRGIAWFLVLTFAITYLVDLGLILAGFRFEAPGAVIAQLVVATTMWVPAFAAFVTIRFVTHEGYANTGLRFGSWRPYVATAFLVPAAFLVIYAITWGTGLASPDWELTELMRSMEQAGADMAEAPPTGVLLPVLLFASLFMAPFINSLFGFGEEYGWRGYLLPKLMPLGKPLAYVSLGVIWGLWHAPLILVGFNYPGYPVLGVLGMIGLTTTLGIYMNELTLHYRSSILAGWIHGVFNAQGYGIWRVLFPTANPLLGGITGLIGMAVWLAIGLATAWYYKDKPAA